MSDLLTDIADRLTQEFGFKLKAGGKYLQQGKCPSCSKPSLWTYAASPWVVKCERVNNCGHEAHAKELYPDLFESWTERYQVPELAKPVAQQNPHAAADAYLRVGRGFDLALITGTYTQEHYFDPRADQGRGGASSTVRFQVAQTWWERIIDRPQRFGKKKANFKAGGSYAGHWWALPSLSFVAAPPPSPETAIADAMARAMKAPSADGLAEAAPAGAPAPLPPPAELWLVEGIFDAIALAHHGIAAVALMSCNNYPEHALAELDAQLKHQGGLVAHPTLVWALDGDAAGRSFTRKHVARAREAGWVCTAAQIPQRGRAKVDWNDLHQRDRLGEADVKDYRYHGALLLAATAQDKALLIYNHTGRGEFDFDHSNRLYWFKVDLERYRKASETIDKDIEAGHRAFLTEDERREMALRESGVLRSIANCLPTALYYQRNDVTDESWYYFRVGFPHDGADIKNTFAAGQLSAASEFKKRLLEMAPGAVYSGNSLQLERIMERQLYNIRKVQTVDFIGYSSAHATYLLGQVAVREGRVHEVNKEDYFEIDNLSVKTLQRSIKLHINTEASAYDRTWVRHLWQAFGPKGYIALAFWFGSLFAEQIRAEQASFPFLEIVGEPGSGKSTLIQFLWKLLGRDYEGFDPSKSTSAGRMRTFTQVSNLPIVLIESDRETKSGAQAHVKSFDWDELKDAYNGNSIRTTGVKTGGNETYDPPFRAAIVISQNNQVQASQAIMERICHMTFDTRGFTPQSYESAKALEKVEIDQVSGFILAALRREAHVLETINTLHEGLMQSLLAQDGIHKPRVAKNHAQLLSIATALRQVVKISDAEFGQVEAQIVAMARERQQSINADHPLVQEFWEAFDYLDGLGTTYASGARDDKPLLNHSRHADEIAVNLNEFVERAAAHRQQIPVLADLKKVLRTSKSRRFMDIKSVNSAIKTRNDGFDTPRTVHCWVFERPSGARRKP
ncbi:MAG: toprim domain-containing protein [Burkholderiales bacterium]|nr:toprim domain-containing protein [Burkholderiales bacterium]